MRPSFILSPFFLLALAASLAADDKLVKLIEKVKPSVVTVDTDKGMGTGFVISESKVMTNYHVITGASEVKVTFQDGSTKKVHGTMFVDKARDMAVLSIDKIDQSIKPLELLTGLPKQGSDVIALGNPQGFEFSVTRGIVSNVRSAESVNEVFDTDKYSGTWVQTDAAMSPGNSGGPLMNQDGKVVGMNTLNHIGGQNLNFAISSVDINSAIESSKIGKLTKTFPKDGAGDASNSDYSFMSKIITKHVKEKLKKLTNRQVRNLGTDNLSLLFPKTKVNAIKEGQLVHIQEKGALIQIFKDGSGMLAVFSHVNCVIILPDYNGNVIREKINNTLIPDMQFDAVYYVGKTYPYTTIGGSTSAYRLILPITKLKPEIWKSPIEEAISTELKSRRLKVVKKSSAEKKKKVNIIKETAEERALKRLRRTFVDSTGKNKIEATAVEIKKGFVRIIRTKDGKEFTVSVSSLSKGDQTWLNENRTWIEIDGSEAEAAVWAGVKKKNIESGRPTNSGLPWTERDLAELKSEYKKNTSIKQMAETLERPQLAIAIQLEKLGLLTVDEVEQYKP